MVINKQDFLAGQMGKVKERQEKALKAAQNRMETRVQTGSEELSEKEWKKLLKRVDQAIGQEEESEEGIER